MEEWVQVNGHPHHFVSNLGRVKSVDHVVIDKGRPSHRKGRIFKLSAGGNGYIRVVLEKKWYTVHRLVAMAFIPRIEGKNVVNHKNGIKTDNRAENLEWVTTSENGIHAYHTGLNGLTEKGRERLRKYHTGRTHSDETKRKLSEVRKGKSWGNHSEESRKKISLSIKRIWQDRH